MNPCINADYIYLFFLGIVISVALLGCGGSHTNQRKNKAKARKGTKSNHIKQNNKVSSKSDPVIPSVTKDKKSGGFSDSSNPSKSSKGVTNSCFSSTASHHMHAAQKEVLKEKIVKGVSEVVGKYTSTVSSSIKSALSDQLKIIPANLRFSTKMSSQFLEIHNLTKERLAIKAKCSDNRVYRINPVFTFVEARHHVRVNVSRDEAPFKIDKLVFIASKAARRLSNPRDVFKPENPNSLIYVVPLFVTCNVSRGIK